MDREAELRFEAWTTARMVRLHRFAYLLCGDWYVAEDLVQDALAKTALHWGRIEHAEYPDAYVRKMIANGTRSMWRRREPAAVATGNIRLSSADRTDEMVAHDELISALRQLPARQRAALVLRYFDQLSEAETAATLGCSVGTVKSQTSKALANLRRVMIKEGQPC